MNNLAVLHAFVIGLTCCNELYMNMRLLYLKFGVMDGQESSQTENAIHWERHTIRTFRLPIAHPVLV